jgi:hypothetical protein
MGIVIGLLVLALVVFLVRCWVVQVREGRSEAASLTAGALVVLLLVAGVASWGVYRDRSNPRFVTGVVKSRYVKSFGSGKDRSDYFMLEIQADDGTVEVVQVRDSLWAFDSPSANAYATLSEGQKVHLLVAGPREPFLSMFPRLVRVN